MHLSIIIVNYSAAHVLTHCLASLGKHLKAIQHDICIIDNASTDGSQALVKTQFPHVQLICNKSNLGFAAAVNIGLRNARGDYVLWLNPDAELLDDGIAELIQYLAVNPKVGIIGPQLVDANGHRQLSCRSFPSYQTVLFHRYSWLTRWFPSNRYSREYLHTDWNDMKIREVDWVSGACLLHRRKVADELGGLDEKFFMYCEDVDFCLRARQHGWSVQYHPVARVLHRIAVGGSHHKPYRVIIERHRSMWCYYAKHFPRNFLKDLLIRIGVILRCIIQILACLWKTKRIL